MRQAKPKKKKKKKKRGEGGRGGNPHILLLISFICCLIILLLCSWAAFMQGRGLEEFQWWDFHSIHLRVDFSYKTKGRKKKTL